MKTLFEMSGEILVVKLNLASARVEKDAALVAKYTAKLAKLAAEYEQAQRYHEEIATMVSE